MKLTQVKGSTWVLEANELIPLYLLDDRRCVLLDSGLAKEREEIEKTLLEAGWSRQASCAPTPMWTTAPITGIFRRSTTSLWHSPPRRRGCAAVS